MKTPYLDRQIDLLEIHERLQELTDDGKDTLIEYKAIKEQLLIHSVSKSVTCGNCDKEESDWFCKKCYDNAENSIGY